jgi:hypothetical protein
MKERTEEITRKITPSLLLSWFRQKKDINANSVAHVLLEFEALP